MQEPTSGLDARAAAIVMRTVKNTVLTGRTVVCTIHQPSIDIFEVRAFPGHVASRQAWLGSERWCVVEPSPWAQVLYLQCLLCVKRPCKPVFARKNATRHSTRQILV